MDDVGLFERGSGGKNIVYDGQEKGMERI